MNFKTQEEEKRDADKRKFVDGLDQYFRYKSNYEGLIKNEKNKINKLPGLSWREKRIEFMKIKPKCVNCKRPVGSIFSTKVDDDGRHLIAICGDRKAPCPFNININLGLVENIRDNLNSDEDALSQNKREIIIDKNDMLFGYITEEEAVEKFDKIKKAVSDDNLKEYEFTLQTYLNIIDNDEKKTELEKLQLEFYNNLDNFNSLVNQYKEKQNTQLIIEAIDLYVNTMQPRINEIMNKKYAYNSVEYNEQDNTFHLIQIPITNEMLEWDLTDNGQKVVSFKTGVEIKKKSVKTGGERARAIPDIKEKVIIEEDDDDESDYYLEPGKFTLNPRLKIEGETDLESVTELDDDSNSNSELVTGFVPEQNAYSDSESDSDD